VNEAGQRPVGKLLLGWATRPGGYRNASNDAAKYCCKIHQFYYGANPNFDKTLDKQLDLCYDDYDNMYD